METVYSFARYILLVLLSSYFSEASFSQAISQRAWSLSTNFEVRNVDRQGDGVFKRSYYSAGLQGNIFIAKNLSAVLGLSYQKENISGEQKDLPENWYAFSEELTTVFVQSRKYWFLQKSFALYVQAGYGFGIGKDATRMENYQSAGWIENHEISIKPGIIFFPSDYWALEMTLGNVAVNQRMRRPESQSTVYEERRYVFKLAPVLNLGVHYFFGGR